MAETITYGERVKGWTSFHSYHPDWMCYLGSDFFSFKNGNLYKHDTNDTRTNFYGTSYGAKVTFSSNKFASDVKLYKNIKLETNSNAWFATLVSELENGEIGSSGNLKFEGKEDLYYGYIRRLSTDTLNFNELSILGIGNLVSNPSSNVYVVNNTIPNQVSANNSDNLGGDTLYFNNGSANNIIGTISTISDKNFVTTASANQPSIGNFLFVAKNPQSESFGLRGYHCLITLTNNSTSFVELFASNAEVFKSFM